MMNWFDWALVCGTIVLVLGVAVYSRRYVRDVTGFLSAGRVCGRYVISVGDIATGMSVIGLVAIVEVNYKTGFALTFWNSVILPLSVVMGLFGFCTYRFRETRAQSIGQYIEMRYSRSLRIFSAALRSFSEMFANMIMPALAARFFIAFLDLPANIPVFGIQLSTFHVLMIVILTVAISIICMGGTLAIIVTDTIQGFLCYPLMALFAGFILYRFSWSGEILPVMLDRVARESFLNPYDIENLRDFNVFSLIVTLVVLILHRVSWAGAGAASSAARSPHEQKMANLLGTWRGAIGGVFCVLIAISVLTVMNHRNFSTQAGEIRSELTGKIAGDVVSDPNLRARLVKNLHSIPKPEQRIGIDRPMSEKKNLDTVYLDRARETLTMENPAGGNAVFQEFRTLYYQLMLPFSLRGILPNGMLGLFCVLMIVLMISTDDTRIFSAAITLSQDVILPFLKKAPTQEQHIRILRLVSIGIGVFFFAGSSFMAQLDYINLYVTLVCSMWLGGCGPMLVFGLYSKRGTTAGAWTSLLTGVGMALGGVLIQRNWADTVYPYLEGAGLTLPLGNLLAAISGPFNPFIVWEMNPVKCPVNSYEWYFITMLVTLILYCGVSLATCRVPFNLERMLHRGKYGLDGERRIESPWSWRNVYDKLIGITPEYTFGDKIIAWCYFSYSIVYRFLGSFVLVVLWNMFRPWPASWWGIYFLVVMLIVPGVMALVTAVWFGICGTTDLIRMFRDLEARVIDPLDDGRVEGGMSVSDKSVLEKIDRAS